LGIISVIRNGLRSLVHRYTNIDLLLQFGVESDMARNQSILYRNASIDNRNRKRIRGKKFTKTSRSSVRNKIKLRDAIKIIARFFQRIEKHITKVIPIATLILAGAIYKRSKNDKQTEERTG
jgi:hypothetical protein